MMHRSCHRVLRRRVQILGLVVAVVLPAGGLLRAQTLPATEPSTEPTSVPAEDAREPRPGGSDDRPDRPGRNPGFPFGEWGRGGGGPPGMREDPDAERWNEIARFMKENSHYRWSVYERLENEKKDPEVLRAARSRFAWRYSTLERLKNFDSGLYDFGVKRFSIEDRVLEQLDKARGDNSPDLDKKIDDSIGEWFDVQFAERQKRLDSLKEYIKREESALASDKDKKGDLIQRQRQNFERESQRLLNPPPPPPRNRGEASPEDATTRPAD